MSMLLLLWSSCLDSDSGLLPAVGGGGGGWMVASVTRAGGSVREGVLYAWFGVAGH